MGKNQLISDEVREDLIVTALEGGSNYWYFINEDSNDVIQKHKTEEKPYFSEAMATAIKNDETIEIHDIENEDEKLGEINLKSISKAEEILLKEYKDVIANIISENYDAEDADVFFQLAVLGEVVFG